MSKRKVELQPLGTLVPPCKRRVWEPQPFSRRCSPETIHTVPKRKRKLETMSAISVEVISLSECDRLELADRPATSSSPPCKKLRILESHNAAAPTQFKSQKDEAFCDFNSFQYWRMPLPSVDFSELEVEACEDDRKSTLLTDVLEEMDN